MRPRQAKWAFGAVLAALPFLGCVAMAAPQQANPPQIPPEIARLANDTVKKIAQVKAPGVLTTQLESCFGENLCDQLDAALHDELVAQISSVRFVSRDEATKYLAKHGFLSIDAYLGALDDVAGDAGADIVISEDVSWTGKRCQLETKISGTKPLTVLGDFQQHIDCPSTLTDRSVLLKDSNTGAAILVSDPHGPLILKPGNYPKCVACPLPKYSPDLRKRRAEGVVHILVTVTAEGKLEDPSVLGAADAEMARVSLLTMINWRLSPATDQNGNPFPGRTLVEVNFRLR